MLHFLFFSLIFHDIFHHPPIFNRRHNAPGRPTAATPLRTVVRRKVLCKTSGHSCITLTFGVPGKPSPAGNQTQGKKTPFFHIKANLLTINGLNRTVHIPQNKHLAKYRLLQYKKPPFTPKKHTLHAAKACFRQIERHPSARKSA